MEKPDAGYDGPNHPEEEGDLREDTVKFHVERLSRFFVTSGTVAQVFRNGEAVGIIRLQSEEEYLHVKKSLTGRMEDEQVQGDSE